MHSANGMATESGLRCGGSSYDLGTAHRCGGRGLVWVCLCSLMPVLVCMCVHPVEWNERCVKECKYIVLPLVHSKSVKLLSNVRMAFCLLLNLIAK